MNIWENDPSAGTVHAIIYTDPGGYALKRTYTRTAALLLAVLLLLSLTGCDSRKTDYDKATALMDAGDYASALEAFSVLGDYKDSADMAAECDRAARFNEAVALMESGEYEEALQTFGGLTGYRDSNSRAAECSDAILQMEYDEANTFCLSGNYEKAASLYRELGDYRDSKTLLIEVLKLDADRRFYEYDYKGANKLFTELAQLGVTDIRISVTDTESAYAYAMMQHETGNDEEALRMFMLLWNFRDSSDWAKICRKNIEGWPLAELVENGSVSAEVSTQYIDFATLTVTNNTDKVINIVIPFGTWLSSKSKSVQNMLITSEQRCTLDPNFSTTINVDTACMNISRHIPELDDGYEIKTLAEDDPLLKLMPVLSENYCGYYVIQAAVWMVTDNADYNDLGILINQYEERVIDEEDYQMAIDMLEMAGIN
jgi:tetratricopeptide (TPR) repeat protein